jgi:hypothetical protein
VHPERKNGRSMYSEVLVVLGDVFFLSRSMTDFCRVLLSSFILVCQGLGDRERLLSILS